MAKKKRNRIQLNQAEGFGSSLGDRLGISLPTLDNDSQQLPKEIQPSTPEETSIFDVQLKVSRKGYGGKTVTEVRGLAFSDPMQETQFTRTLAKTMGVRVFWKASICCVQGDQANRLRDYFQSLGHRIRS